jgi:polysaccharide deacetylase 2 family uncharacterized protein YibQ
MGSYPDELTKLPFHVTMAVIPGMSQSQKLGVELREKGYEVIMHMPMETLKHNEEYPLKLTKKMTYKRMVTIMKKSFEGVPGAVGINNHMGSTFTEDQKAMEKLMKFLRAYNLYFLDSRTSMKTKGRPAAEKYGVAYIQNNAFLDGKLERGYIKQQFNRMVALAKKKGWAVGIAHANRPFSVKFLAEIMPQYNVQYVFVSELLKEGTNDQVRD